MIRWSFVKNYTNWAPEARRSKDKRKEPVKQLLSFDGFPRDCFDLRAI